MNYMRLSELKTGAILPFQSGNNERLYQSKELVNYYDIITSFFVNSLWADVPGNLPKEYSKP